MTEETTPISEPVRKPSVTVGLIAVGVAGTGLVAQLASRVLESMGRRWHNLSTVFGWFVFDFGFILDLLATLLAVIAVCIGGRSRRFGLLALLCVAASLLLMFI
ncbi:MAG: hypothetical protein ABIP55_12205 [Tepidisphaeraceae bacterium]